MATFPHPDRDSINARFEMIRDLDTGWDEQGYDSEAFDPDLVDQAQAFVYSLVDDFDIPAPFIYPTFDTEIELEWEFGPISPSITINPEWSRGNVTSCVIVFPPNRDDPLRDFEDEEELRIPLGDPDTAQKVAILIHNIRALRDYYAADTTDPSTDPS